MGLFSKSKKDRPSKTNDSKSSKTQNLEVLVSAKEFDDGQNKIGLAERFTIIKRNDSKKTFTVQIESLISQEDIDFLKNKKGEDDLTVKNLVPGWNKISFDVPEDLVLESRKNQTENTKDIFNRIAQNDIEYFKGPEYSNWAKEISIDGKLNAQSIRDGVGNSLLHLAASHGFLELTIYFVEQAKFSPDIQNDFGNTPLMEVVSRRKLDDNYDEIVRYLIRAKSNLTIRNKIDLAAIDLVADSRLKIMLQEAMGIATENVLAKMFVEKMEDEDEDSG